jgi:hypothetical protein
VTQLVLLLLAHLFLAQFDLAPLAVAAPLFLAQLFQRPPFV